jgi:hypothetical protein
VLHTAEHIAHKCQISEAASDDLQLQAAITQACKHTCLCTCQIKRGTCYNLDQGKNCHA